MKDMKLLSFVIPCYRSEKTIKMVIEEIITVVAQREGYDYEIICVNDFSPDGVYNVLKKLAEEDQKIKVVNFAANKGKHSAVLAGLKYAKGEIIVNLDDDFQCPAYEMWKLIEPIENDECDFDCARYYQRKESAWKRLGSELNNRITAVLLERSVDLYPSNFYALKRFVAEEMIRYDGPFPYIEGLVLRATRRIMLIPMEERDRADENKTGFTLKKSVMLFLNGLTAFSVKPLRISTVAGAIAAVAGAIMAILILIKKITGAIDVAGYSSIIIIMLILGGMILMSLGLIGEYIGRVYISINKSPQYVIKDTLNIEDQDSQP